MSRINGGATTAYEQLAGRILHGTGALASLGDELARLGCKRPVIVTSQTVAKGDLVAQSKLLLGATVPVCDGSVEHVPLSVVDEVCAVIREFRADVLVAIGGGSALDTAKAAALAVAARAPLLEIYEGSSYHRECFDHGTVPKIVTVPTTVSGAERTGAFSVLSDSVKLNFAEDHCRPAVVIQDSHALMTSPRRLLAGSVMNSLAHSVEALQTPRCSPFARVHHLQAITGYVRYFPVAMSNPADVAAHEELHLAAAFANGIAGARSGGVPGVVHALAHAVTGVTRAPHGEVYGVLLPLGLSFNAPYAVGAGAEIAKALTEGRSESIDDAVTVLAKLRAVGGIASKLRELSVPRKSLRIIADTAMQHFGIAMNIRSISSADELFQILEAAY